MIQEHEGEVTRLTRQREQADSMVRRVQDEMQTMLHEHQNWLELRAEIDSLVSFSSCKLPVPKGLSAGESA